MNSHPNRQRMTEYLLGELSAEEQAKFEEQYTANADVFEELIAAENDLVDGYASGTLTDVERKHFEAHYLGTPRRRQRAEFARTLMNYFPTADAVNSAPELPAPGPSHGGQPLPSFVPAEMHALRWIAAVVFLFAVCASMWMWGLNRRLRHELEDERAKETALERQSQQYQQQIAELTSVSQGAPGQQSVASPPLPGPPVAFLTLTAGFRSGSRDPENTLVITNHTSSAQLRLKLDRRVYRNYAVLLETADETPLWQQTHLQSEFNDEGIKALFINLPSNLLKPGDYILKLSGTTAAGSVQDINEYGFRIVKREH